MQDLAALLTDVINDMTARWRSESRTMRWMDAGCDSGVGSRVRVGAVADDYFYHTPFCVIVGRKSQKPDKGRLPSVRIKFGY